MTPAGGSAPLTTYEHGHLPEPVGADPFLDDDFAEQLRQLYSIPGDNMAYYEGAFDSFGPFCLEACAPSVMDDLHLLADRPSNVLSADVADSTSASRDSE